MPVRWSFWGNQRLECTQRHLLQDALAPRRAHQPQRRACSAAGVARAVKCAGFRCGDVVDKEDNAALLQRRGAQLRRALRPRYEENGRERWKRARTARHTCTHNFKMLATQRTTNTINTDVLSLADLVACDHRHDGVLAIGRHTQQHVHALGDRNPRAGLLSCKVVQVRL